MSSSHLTLAHHLFPHLYKVSNPLKTVLANIFHLVIFILKNSTQWHLSVKNIISPQLHLQNGLVVLDKIWVWLSGWILIMTYLVIKLVLTVYIWNKVPRGGNWRAPHLGFLESIVLEISMAVSQSSTKVHGSPC